ncbi:MAG: PCRF domain-containing protein, partial [Flavobacteriales bacterium]|nr:PCRF domain-containing protein [Flavobacteriales bacterium]
MFDIDSKLNAIADDEKLTEAPDFWDDPKKAEAFLKTISKRKVWTNAYESCNSGYEDLNVLFEFNVEGEATEEEVDAQYAIVIKLVEDLEFKNMLSGEEDSMNAVLQINSGAGGTE